MIRFGVVGTGWRTQFFLRIAQARPDLFEVVGVVTRDAARAADWARPFGVRLFESLDEMLAQNPLYVITSVSWDANPPMIHALAEHGVPILSETPPAPDVERLKRAVSSGAKWCQNRRYGAVSRTAHARSAHCIRA